MNHNLYEAFAFIVFGASMFMTGYSICKSIQQSKRNRKGEK